MSSYGICAGELCDIVEIVDVAFPLDRRGVDAADACAAYSEWVTPPW